MPDISFQEAMDAVGTLVAAFEKAASHAPLTVHENIMLTYVMFMAEQGVNGFPTLTDEEVTTWERLSARAHSLLLTEPTGCVQ